MDRSDWWFFGSMAAFVGTFVGLILLGLLTSPVAAKMSWPFLAAFAFVDVVVFGLAGFGWLTLARLFMTRAR